MTMKLFSGRLLRRQLQVLLKQRGLSTAPRIIKSQYSQIEVPECNLSDFVLKNAGKLQDLPAIICGEQNTALSYSQVKSLSRRIGSALLDAGLGPGKRISTVLPNSTQFGPILLGSVGIGATLVPVSPLLTSTELERIFQSSRPEIIFTLSGLTNKISTATQELKRKPLILCLDQLEGSSSYNNFIQVEEDGYDRREDFDLASTAAVLPYSSGTTGMPKGVMLSHKNLMTNLTLLNNLESGCSVAPHDPESGLPQFSMFSIIPTFHIYGLTCNILQPLSAGIQIIMLPKFEPTAFLSCLEKYKPSFLNIVPPLITFLATNPNVKRDVHLSGCRTISSGGSPISSHTLKALQDKAHPYPIMIKEGYGMTECPIVTRTKIPKLGSVGKLINNMQVKIVDPETGSLQGPNQPGELWVKGDQVMMGYFENEEETKEALRDGWLHTGDILYYDEEENFYVVDRIKDMIKVKGYQVSPTELENEMKAMEDILEVAVIGVKHEKFGEAPRAFIVAKNESLTADMVNKWMEGKVTAYKRLAGGIVFVKELPKSPTGKVLRKELKKMV